MYHSVLDPESGSNTLGRTMHSPEVFRGHAEIIARYYDPVSMDDVLKFLQGKKDLPPRAVAVTFDDGYRDNYEMAAPILDGAGVPATFYVAVGSIESGNLPWPARLRYAFYTTALTRWSDPHGALHLLTTGPEREQAMLFASDYCAPLSGSPQESFVQAVEAELEVDPKRHRGLMMNWDHLRALVDHGHIVGSHTMTHPNLAHVSDEQARIELFESKRRLEAELGSPVLHFAYPCPALQPHWKETTVEISRQAGYLTAVTTDGGSVCRRDDPLHLRRAGPTKKIEGLRWSVDCCLLGRTPRVWKPVEYAPPT